MEILSINSIYDVVLCCKKRYHDVSEDEIEINETPRVVLTRLVPAGAAGAKFFGW